MNNLFNFIQSYWALRYQYFLNLLSIIFVFGLTFLFVKYFNLDNKTIIDMSICFSISFIISYFILEKFKFSNNFIIRIIQKIVINSIFYFIIICICSVLPQDFTPITKNKLLDDDSLFNNLFDFNGLKDYYNQFLDYVNSLSLENQIIIFNVLVAISLLILLLNTLTLLYSNYLIERLDLINKYPRLGRLLQYRLQFSKYYFNYYVVLAFVVILFTIFFNCLILYLNLS